MKLVRLLAILFVSIACSNQFYYKKVKTNTSEFDRIVDYLDGKKILEGYDSLTLSQEKVIRLKNNCIWQFDIGKTDPVIYSFMVKYDLTKICLSENDQFIGTTFHKHYSPFFSGATVIFYDNGESKLRALAISGEKAKGEIVKIIDKKYLLRRHNKPAFGE